MAGDALVGAVFIIISTFVYGTTFVLIKPFATHDGMFVQLMMCVGQMLVGLVSACLAGFPPLYPLALLGGAIYAVANVLCLCAMRGLGLAIGPLVWNSVTCLVGWAVSRFGLLGNEQVIPASDVLNVAGVAIVCLGGACFALVKSSPVPIRPAPFDAKPRADSDWEKCAYAVKGLGVTAYAPEKETTTGQRVVSLFLCVVCGCLFGNMTTPMSYSIRYHEYYNAPADVPQYLFSHFYGAFVTSVLIFGGYCMYKRNVPLMNPEVAGPAVVAGIFYSTATCTFFTANQMLGQVIVYPVIAITPGMVVTMWSILYFREIKGKANLHMLVAGYGLSTIGVTCIVLSKIQF